MPDSKPESIEHHAICPLCIRVVSKEDRSKLQDVVENHNDRRHESEHVAQIVEADELDDFMGRVKSQHGPEVYGEIGAHVVKVDPWGII